MFKKLPSVLQLWNVKKFLNTVFREEFPKLSSRFVPNISFCERTKINGSFELQNFFSFQQVVLGTKNKRLLYGFQKNKYTLTPNCAPNIPYYSPPLNLYLLIFDHVVYIRTQRRCSNCTVGTVGIFALRMFSSSHWGRWINPVSHCQGHTYVNLLFRRNIAH